MDVTDISEIPTNMVSNNKEYVKVIDKIRRYLNKGIKSKLLSGEEYNRALSIILMEGDTKFLEPLKKELANRPSIKALADRIIQLETQALRKLQPVFGMEGHHMLVQNVAKRLSQLPTQQALRVMDMYRSLGGGSGVNPNNLGFLAKSTHAAHLFKDMVSAHMDPILNKLDLKFFSKPFVKEGKAYTDLSKKAEAIKDFFFQPVAKGTAGNIELMHYAEKIFDEAWLPGQLLAEQAFLNPSEVKARKYVTDLLDGVDLRKMKDTTLLKKYNQLLNKIGIDYNQLKKGFDAGQIPNVINDEIKAVIKQLNDNPALSTAKINKLLSKGKNWGKNFIRVGAATTVGYVGGLFDLAAAATGVQEVADEEAGFGKKLVGGLRTVSGVSGLASFSGAAAPVAVPVSLLSGAAAEVLNYGLDYHARGGAGEGDAPFSLIGTMPELTGYNQNNYTGGQAVKIDEIDEETEEKKETYYPGINLRKISTNDYSYNL